MILARQPNAITPRANRNAMPHREMVTHRNYAVTAQRGRVRMTNDDYRYDNEGFWQFPGSVWLRRFKKATNLEPNRIPVSNPVTKFYPPTPNSNRNPLSPRYIKSSLAFFALDVCRIIRLIYIYILVGWIYSFNVNTVRA